MIKSILVCTDGSPHGTSACRYAIRLARDMKARLAGLHVLDSRMLEGPLMADISGWIGAQPFGAQLQQFRELMQQKGETIMEAFQSLCAEANLEADGDVKMGHPATIILEEEKRAELVVLGQDGEHADLTGKWIGSTVERVVRHSIKPCLVVPLEAPPVAKILVAYDGSGHGSKALHEAVEMALALSAPLVILSVSESHDLEKARDTAEEGMKLARAHECAAAQLIVEGSPEQLIPAKAEELGCNLIVVGAHGHSRIREMILGSTSMSLVTQSRVPVMVVR